MDLLALGDYLRERLHPTPERVEKGELRPRHGLGVNACTKLMLVTPRQGVSRRVLPPRLVLHLKTIPKEFAYPGVLRYCREMLIQEVLETAMVRTFDELHRPQIRPPVAHGLHESNELTLICCQLGVLWRDGAAEEGYWPMPLM